MIEETATVVGKDGYYVWVETASRSGCHSCGSQGSCASSVLSGLFKPRRNRLRVFDPYNLEVGERAVLGMRPGELVKAAFFAYLVPLMLMVATALSVSNQGHGDSTVMLLSLCSLAAGFILVRYIGGRLPGGLVQVFLLRRVEDEREQSIPFINLERSPS